MQTEGAPKRMPVFFLAGAAAGFYLAASLIACARRRSAERRFPPIGQFCRIQTGAMHYVRRGSGPSVVMLHGSDGFVQDFVESVAPRLAEEYDVIVIDRPGHGYSDAPRGGAAGVAAQERALQDLFAQLSIDRPLLAAYSWSAVLALYIAWRRPDAISGVVLVAPWLRPLRHRRSLTALLAHPILCTVLHPLFVLVKEQALGFVLRLAFFPGVPPDRFRREAIALWMRYPRQMAVNLLEIGMSIENLCGFDVRDLPENVPISVIAGSEDRIAPPTLHAAALGRALPGARVEIVAGAGHEIQFTHPDLIIAAIRRCAVAAAQMPPAVSAAAREAPRRARTDPGRGELARELVMRYGWNATAYQVLNPELTLWFSRDEEACVGYVRHNGVRVVAGAPVCTEARLPETTWQFECDAQQDGETVCYFGAAARLHGVLSSLPGHCTVLVGEQPYWNPAGWQTILEQHRSLRTQLRRAQNKGVRVTEWPVARAIQSVELRDCFAEWHSRHSAFALGFLTEPVPPSRLGDRRVFVAEQNRKAVGFLLATPIPDRDGWLVEQIVRRRDAPNGSAELMIDCAMPTLAGDGASYVTLGLAPLSNRTGSARTRLLWLRLLLAWARAHGTRFYNFEGLDYFKAKFRPDSWEPIYAISNERRFSPRTLYAVAAAFTGGAPIKAISGVLAGAVTTEVRGALHRRSTD